VSLAFPCRIGARMIWLWANVENNPDLETRTVILERFVSIECDASDAEKEFDPPAAVSIMRIMRFNFEY